MARSIGEHIRNVKSSLENAEQSFRENNSMRGELDLMLAEAEIKHLREKRGGLSVWNRQRLALVVAVLVVLAGYGGWLYAGRMDTGQVTLNEIQGTAAAEIVTAAPPTQNLPQTEAAPLETSAFTDKSAEKQQNTAALPAQQAEQIHEQRAVDLPTADMRQLVREARRTLRDAN